MAAPGAIVSDNQIYVRGKLDSHASGIFVGEPAINVDVHDNLVRNCANGITARRCRLSRGGRSSSRPTGRRPGWRNSRGARTGPRCGLWSKATRLRAGPDCATRCRVRAGWSLRCTTTAAGGCGDWCNHLGKYPALENSWYCGTSTTEEALNVVKTGDGLDLGGRDSDLLGHRHDFVDLGDLIFHALLAVADFVDR